MRHRDDGANDGFVVRVDADIANEGRVDLDRVHRQLLQVGKRRVAGAEIIDRQAQAHIAELL